MAFLFSHNLDFGYFCADKDSDDDLMIVDSDVPKDKSASDETKQKSACGLVRCMLTTFYSHSPLQVFNSCTYILVLSTKCYCFELGKVFISGSTNKIFPHSPSPYGTQFFRFHIHFHRKEPTSEVHVPQNGSMPPHGKSWIRPWF